MNGVPNGGVPLYAIPNTQKPVHVDGYTRRDGTYVREHWRTQNPALENPTGGAGEPDRG